MNTSASSLLSSASIDARRMRIVEGFFRHRIVIVNAVEPFRLASGALAPLYLDHRLAFSIPGLREDLAGLWADTLRASPEFSALLASDVKDLVVAGTATAGIAPAYALASAIGAHFVYVRSKPKAHGRGRMVEGAWNEGAPCLVVDDMVTTGKSLLEAAKCVRESGGRALLATSVTRHAFARTDQAFAAEGLPLVSCFTSSEIFAIAAHVGLLDAAGLNAVSDWIAAQDASPA